MTQIAVHVEDEGDSASSGQRSGGQKTGAGDVDDVGGETDDFPGQAGQLAREAKQVADRFAAGLIGAGADLVVGATQLLDSISKGADAGSSYLDLPSASEESRRQVEETALGA